MNTLNLKSTIHTWHRMTGCLLASLLLQMSALAAESDTNTPPFATTDVQSVTAAKIEPQPKDGAGPERPPNMALLIPIIGIIGGLTIPILAIWGEYRKRRDMIEAYHKERMLALEKGMEPPAYPANILEDDDSSSTPPVPGKHLKSGLLWLAIGIGVVIFLYFQPKAVAHFSVGAIPIAIGVSQLIYHLAQKNKTES